ncbi:multidrug effflux MFS transporter [Alcanivorax sp. JB21]|uniref:multidrug effflux MFS transporter n=1 Tax=Alcanivorax limicola TaxID=2874102 RepID=UPI001CBF81DD|nr:multidrug effflux MFS transporter [Alcanivorax limicola]MBZ2188225.1 multidrug effflux MFS transporter [Alcanivorax limicola]
MPGSATHRRTGPLPATRLSIVLLAAMAALGQFASNIYTPSLPAVAHEFVTTTANAQLTFVVFLAVFAAGQLAYGPAADRYGRRPVLFTGLALFLVGTAGCALAPTLDVLIAARVVQAAGAAAGVVVSRAATRDSFEGAELARALAAVTIAFALVPGLTPLLGGLLQSLSGWRSIFWATFVFGAGVAILAVLKLPETLKARSPALNVKSVGSAYRIVLSDPVFLGNAMTVGLVFGSMSAFFAGSPALFIDRLGVGPAEYGLYPPVAVSGFIVGGIAVRRFAGQVPSRRIALGGLGMMVFSLALMLGLPLAGIVHKHAFNAAMVLNVTGLGLFLPIAISAALQRHPGRAGTAASLQGFLQMAGGASGAFAVGLIQGNLPILAMPMTMFAFVTAALLLFVKIPDGVTSHDNVGA